jgi:hypothetical protein
MTISLSMKWRIIYRDILMSFLKFEKQKVRVQFEKFEKDFMISRYHNLIQIKG